MKVINWIIENKILVVILTIGAIFRFYKIDFQSVWLDEIHTMNEANPNLSFLDVYHAVVSSEQMPPLYFYILHFLFMLFGYTTLVLRLFSAVIGVVSIYYMFLLGKEMHSKKIGLFAAFLLCFNYFHFYFSQEGRPYIFLVLFTILAFYKLIIYIKNPTRRNAIFYGIFATLMIYGHFFGLFVLFAQYMILFLFFILIKKQERLKYFINLLISGTITLILYLPAIPLFITATKIKDIWIPRPTPDAYNLIFRDFFGNFEMVIGLVGILILLYFIRLSKEKDFSITYEKIVENKTIFSFVIFAFWIVIVLLIPLIRSYTSLPMIVNRYFIVLLPALILMISIGLNQFKNKIVVFCVLGFFLIFYFVDTIAVKKIYKDPLKTQFREATNFIISNNNDHTPVVTSLGWYLPYFLKNEKVNYKIVDKPLESFIADMQQDSTKVKPFWYLDAHGRPYKLSEITQSFLDKNFYVENNFDGMDAWTKHFILLKNMTKTLDISKFKDLKQTNGDSFKFYVDTFLNAENKLETSGWAYFDEQESANTIITVVLIQNELAFKLLTQKIVRQDVTDAVKNGFNLNNAGFSSKLDLTELKTGNYQLAIHLKNVKTKKEGLMLTDKMVEKKVQNINIKDN